MGDAGEAPDRNFRRSGSAQIRQARRAVEALEPYKPFNILKQRLFKEWNRGRSRKFKSGNSRSRPTTPYTNGNCSDVGYSEPNWHPKEFSTNPATDRLWIVRADKEEKSSDAVYGLVYRAGELYMPVAWESAGDWPEPLKKKTQKQTKEEQDLAEKLQKNQLLQKKKMKDLLNIQFKAYTHLILEGGAQNWQAYPVYQRLSLRGEEQCTQFIDEVGSALQDPSNKDKSDERLDFSVRMLGLDRDSILLADKDGPPSDLALQIKGIGDACKNKILVSDFYFGNYFRSDVETRPTTSQWLEYLQASVNSAYNSSYRDLSSEIPDRERRSQAEEDALMVLEGDFGKVFGEEKDYKKLAYCLFEEFGQGGGVVFQLTVYKNFELEQSLRLNDAAISKILVSGADTNAELEQYARDNIKGSFCLLRFGDIVNYELEDARPEAVEVSSDEDDYSDDETDNAQLDRSMGTLFQFLQQLAVLLGGGDYGVRDWKALFRGLDTPVDLSRYVRGNNVLCFRGLLHRLNFGEDIADDDNCEDESNDFVEYVVDLTVKQQSNTNQVATDAMLREHLGLFYEFMHNKTPPVFSDTNIEQRLDKAKSYLMKFYDLIETPYYTTTNKTLHIFQLHTSAELSGALARVLAPSAKAGGSRHAANNAAMQTGRMPVDTQRRVVSGSGADTEAAQVRNDARNAAGKPTLQTGQKPKEKKRIRPVLISSEPLGQGATKAQPGGAPACTVRYVPTIFTQIAARNVLAWYAVAGKSLSDRSGRSQANFVSQSEFEMLVCSSALNNSARFTVDSASRCSHSRQAKDNTKTPASRAMHDRLAGNSYCRECTIGGGRSLPSQTCIKLITYICTRKTVPQNEHIFGDSVSLTYVTRSIVRQHFLGTINQTAWPHTVSTTRLIGSRVLRQAQGGMAAGDFGFVRLGRRTRLPFTMQVAANVAPNNIYYMINNWEIDTSAMGLLSTASYLGTACHAALDHSFIIHEKQLPTARVQRIRSTSIDICRAYPPIASLTATATYDHLTQTLRRHPKFRAPGVKVGMRPLTGPTTTLDFLVADAASAGAMKGACAVVLRPDYCFDQKEVEFCGRQCNIAMEFKTHWSQKPLSRPVMAQYFTQTILQAHAQSCELALLVIASVPYEAAPNRVECEMWVAGMGERDGLHRDVHRYLTRSFSDSRFKNLPFPHQLIRELSGLSDKHMEMGGKREEYFVYTDEEGGEERFKGLFPVLEADSSSVINAWKKSMETIVLRKGRLQFTADAKASRLNYYDGGVAVVDDEMLRGQLASVDAAMHDCFVYHE